MAPLIEEARSARLEARRLRGEASRLKLTVRRNTANSHEQLWRAEVSLGQVWASRGEPLPSPWSTLRWLDADEHMESTLVPLR